MPKEAKLGAGQSYGSWTLHGDGPLGKGGNGAVWEARDAAGTAAAVKFLHKSHFEQPGQRLARFRDEIEFLTRERNRPGLLPLLDANMPPEPTVANRPWLVTPLAVPFARLDLKGAAKLSELVQRLERLGRTLAGLHAENKYHRDIKPDNLLELNGEPVLGDFGLVDFPGKEAVTTDADFMGPMFYTAPEMMSGAADVPAGPADVYALAKTLWVLGSGQKFPLQGEMRADVPALRLSTYCPHSRAEVLDLLLERATRHEAAQRPLMQAFVDELVAWLTVPATAPIQIDLTALAQEYASVFEIGNRQEQRRTALLQDAQGILGQFDGALNVVAQETCRVTNLPPMVGPAHDLLPMMEFTESYGSPRVLWRGAAHAQTALGDMHYVRLESFAQVEALDDDTIRVLAGHLVRYEAGQSRQLIDLKQSWVWEAVAPRGSAELENGIQAAHSGLIANLGEAIQAFAEQVKATQE